MRAQAKKQPRRAKPRLPGAATRSARTLFQSDAVKLRSMSLEDIYAFWSARLNRIPPPLRTSFGNYTVMNLVDRITFTSLVGSSQYFWIPWTATTLSCLYFTSGSSAVNPIQQRLFKNYISNPPLSIRPLRMSFTLENLTQSTNVAGTVRVLSFDNPLEMAITTGATGTTQVTAVSTPDSTLGALIEDSLETQEPSGIVLEKMHEWVSVPASYPLYNDYYNFVPFGDTTDGANLKSADAWGLITATNDIFEPSVTLLTGKDLAGTQAGGLGMTPPMRNFILQIPAAATPQTYRLTVHRQDGARFAINSVGASFAHAPMKMSSAAEDHFLNMAKHITVTPSRGLKTEHVDKHAASGHHITEMLGHLGSVAGEVLARGASSFGNRFGELAMESVAGRMAAAL